MVTSSTFKSDLQNAMDDEIFHDVRLIGSDNIETSASKYILAARSQYFKLMFYGSSVEGNANIGSFAERDTGIVRLPYPSSVLKVLVKYCYLDELDLDKISGDGDCLTDDDAIRLVQLRDAARYIQFSNDGIFESITDELVDSLLYEQEEESICAVLSELLLRGEGHGNPLWDALMATIKSKPSECLFPTKNTNVCKGIELCSSRLLRYILDQLVHEPSIVVKCLQTWHQQEDADDGENGDNDIQALHNIAQNVDPKSIIPSQLSKIKPDHFFPIERLYEAFVHHGNTDATFTNDDTSSPSVAAKKRAAFVTGAGVDCVNGIYEIVSGLSFGTGCLISYKKSGMYGDVPSEFILSPARRGGNGFNDASRRAGESDGIHWKIVIIPMSSGLESNANDSPLVMYDTKAGTTCEAKVPFSSWNCVDGASPAPCVAIIDVECCETDQTPRLDFGNTQRQARANRVRYITRVGFNNRSQFRMQYD